MQRARRVGEERRAARGASEHGERERGADAPARGSGAAAACMPPPTHVLDSWQRKGARVKVCALHPRHVQLCMQLAAGPVQHAQVQLHHCWCLR